MRRQLAELSFELADLLGKLLGLHLSNAQGLDLGGRQYEPRKLLGVSLGQGIDHLRGNLFRGDRFPRVDFPVFISIQPPAAATGVKPAVLVRLAVGICVDVPVDLEPILEIAPLVDNVVTVGVDEPPQNNPFGILDDPTDAPIDLAGGDLTFLRFIGGGVIEVYPLLDGNELQGLLCRGRFTLVCTKNHRQQKEQTPDEQ